MKRKGKFKTNKNVGKGGGKYLTLKRGGSGGKAGHVKKGVETEKEDANQNSQRKKLSPFLIGGRKGKPSTLHPEKGSGQKKKKKKRLRGGENKEETTSQQEGVRKS